MDVAVFKGSESSTGSFWKYSGWTIYNGKVSASKNIVIVSHVFHNPLRPILTLKTCPPSPAAEKPISVAILMNLPSKKSAMLQKVSVSHGEQKINEMVRMGELLYVRR
jgi:hypothetical protein